MTDAREPPCYHGASINTAEHTTLMPTLTLEQSEQLVRQALAYATERFQRPVCVSVCDHTGLLLAFARMDDAPVRSIAIAQAKAYTAVRMGASTQAVMERLQRENLQMAHFCDAQFTPLPGGTPVKHGDGTLLGAIGVSGLALAEDQQVSDAVAASLAG